ncbi:MAG: rhodanese-like domain-containing protein [Actinobacteria bacterium]|nr:rhodanese-like domain-containing protein [Actinomycetota bacterium]
MKRNLVPVLFIALGLVFALSACSGSTGTSDSSQQSSSTTTETPSSGTKAEYKKLSAEEAKARMDSGGEVLVVDVRTEEEYAQAHIPGAILIPNETITDTPPAQLPDFDAEILVYCRSGNRSKQAATKLIAMGYTNVYDFGGIIDWTYETVSGSE